MSNHPSDLQQPSVSAGEKVVHITFEGKEERAEDLNFDAEKEGWSNYRLSDGTLIKLKNVVSRILKLLDRTKDDGSPFYVLEGTAILTTINPERDADSTREPA
jgi:hypothetical protein